MVWVVFVCRIDGSVLLVFVHDMFTYSVRTDNDECITELKRKICLEWPSLSPSVIDLSFEVGPLQKIVDSTVELQSLICYAIAKGIAHLNVAVFLRNTSSSTSLQSDCYSSNSKCAVVDSEVLEPYVSMPSIFQLAMAVVSAENDENWIWFMKQMKVVIGERLNLVFIFDRHHGLLTSIAQVFPSALHSYCYWHMERNLTAVIPKNHEKRGELLELFHDMAYANTHFEFSQHLEKFVGIGFARATKFVESIPFEHWANAHFKGKRYGELSSSLAESFNSWILEECHLPITALLDVIRVRIMNMYAMRRKKSLDWTTKLCPELEKELSLRMDVSKSWTAVKASETVYEVTTLHKHRIDLEYWKCTCNAWKVEGFPCAHAIRCILGDRKDIYNYCERFFFSSMYRETYAKAIEPISNLDMPSSIDGVAEILPPEVVTQPGRPKTVRIGKTRKQKRDVGRPRSKGYGHHRGKKVSASAMESASFLYK
ncbi:hypothetical protein ACHQM5_000803 [Ranunculus cassubicifolius]